MNLRPGNLEYALSNMALASYAKMSGVPWLITSREPVAHEFVVGLGSAYVGDGIHQDRERVVGITSDLSGEGENTIFRALQKQCRLMNLRMLLSKRLEAAFAKARNEVGWEKGERLSALFSIASSLSKDREAKAVNRLRGKLTDFNVECAFIHVVSSHPWMLIDMAQHGVSVGYKTKASTSSARFVFAFVEVRMPDNDDRTERA